MMARSRNIKPSLFKNEILGVEDPLLTLLFISLWCLADKAGRLEDRPLRIKAETFPYRDGIDINGLLTVIERLGFIQRYECGGVRIIQVVNFQKHQHPHHTEAESILPEYSEGCSVTETSPLSNRVTPSDSLNTDSLNTDSKTLSQRKSAAPEKTELQIVCTKTWNAYKEAYVEKYGIEPIRNAKINSQVRQFVCRIPHEEAPKIAGWFLSHTDVFYVRTGHAFGMLMKDAEKLRTEWATNRRIRTMNKQEQLEESNHHAVADWIPAELRDAI